MHRVLPSPTINSSFIFSVLASTEVYTLSLHDALPISPPLSRLRRAGRDARCAGGRGGARRRATDDRGLRHRLLHRVLERSEEHMSELQSRRDIVCRLRLKKK